MTFNNFDFVVGGVVVAVLGCGPKGSDSDSATGDTGAAMTTGGSPTEGPGESTGGATSESTGGGTTAGDACEDAFAAAQAFVNSHRACEVDADCTAYDAFCYPGATCGLVAVNKEADPATAKQLFGELDMACELCGADPCGAKVFCDAKQCAAAIDL